MKHKVPYSHGFATLAPPPLHIANSFILVKNKIKEHADQSNDNNINNNNIHYDDGMRGESDDLIFLTRPELNRSSVIAEMLLQQLHIKYAIAQKVSYTQPWQLSVFSVVKCSGLLMISSLLSCMVPSVVTQGFEPFPSVNVSMTSLSCASFLHTSLAFFFFFLPHVENFLVTANPTSEVKRGERCQEPTVVY